MNILITSSRQYGPFASITQAEDRWICDGAEYQFSVIGEASIGEYIAPPPSDEQTAEQAAQARAQRTRLLAECDWVVVKSLESGQPILAEWATYRQALRDLPQQAGFPVTIDWPVKP